MHAVLPAVPLQLAEEAKDYEAAVKAGPKVAPGGDVDLGMRVLLVHGDEVRRCSMHGFSA